jgi:cytochrome c5
MRSRLLLIVVATGLAIWLLSIFTVPPALDSEPRAMSPSLAPAAPIPSPTSRIGLADVGATAAASPTSWTALADKSVAPTPSPTSWIGLPDMPATATQADIGAEVYRLVCSACHGGGGQGLTDGWRATWTPSAQDCWQSKCHAVNHPPDGFVLPRYVPPVIGPNALVRFETTLDLYNYIRATMPWHSPGSLLDREYWQLTAFLAREHHLDLGDLPLNADRASKQLLSP